MYQLLFCLDIPSLCPSGYILKDLVENLFPTGKTPTMAWEFPLWTIIQYLTFIHAIKAPNIP